MSKVAAGGCFSLIALLAAGCGGTSSNAQLQSTIRDLSRVIRSYNNTRATKLSETGANCGRAKASIAKDEAWLRKYKPSSSSHQLVKALREAATLATHGFSHCQQAATNLNYPLMIRAEGELSAANTWLGRARLVGARASPLPTPKASPTPPLRPNPRLTASPAARSTRPRQKRALQVSSPPAQVGAAASRRWARQVGPYKSQTSH